MSRPCFDHSPTTTEENDEKWELVTRVSSSRNFVRAPQLKNIFLYVCQRALSDPGAAIKEQEIACSALGRKPDFNPHEDNIVRVQISHLRRKLDEHFASEGKDEPICITIPKGSYVPIFHPKVQPRALLETGRKPLAVPVLSAATVVLTLLCAVLLFRPVASSAPQVPRAPGPDTFWGRIFGTSQPASVIVSDTCMVMLQDVLDTDVSAADYAASRFPQEALNSLKVSPLRSALQLLISRQYTSLADLTLSEKLLDISRQFGPAPALIRYARHLNIRDFKNGNFVFLGSRRGIPWVQLFEPQLNFTIEEDKVTHRFYFRNKSPRIGEPAAFVPEEKSGSTDTYSDIALLPNLARNGVVLILSGLTMVDTESAGEFLCRKNTNKELSRILTPEVVRDRFFELLLKTRSVAGAASSAQVVAFRAIDPGATYSQQPDR